jgi:hypothetical protein
MKWRILSTAVVPALLGIGTSTCITSDEAQEEVVVAGTVHQAAVGGSCWCIVTGDGEKYEVTNLAAEYRTEGLAVRAHLRLRPDMASTCMVGKIANVSQIEELGQ